MKTTAENDLASSSQINGGGLVKDTKPKQVTFTLIVAFLSLIGILLGIGWLGLSRMALMSNNIQEIADQRWARVKLANEAMLRSQHNSRITMQIFLLDDRQEIDALLAQRANNTARITKLLEKIETGVLSEKEKALLNAIRAHRTPYIDSYKLALNLLLKDGQPEAARQMMSKTVTPNLYAYHKAWEDFVTFEGGRMDRAADSAEAYYFTANKLVLLLLCIALLLACAIAIFVTRGTSREIWSRLRAEQGLREAHEVLERRVEQRTAELSLANTELVATHRELQTSEQRFSGAFKYAPIGLALVSTDGRFFKVNKALCELLHYSENELLERTFQDITDPQDLQFDLEKVSEMLSGKIQTYQMEKSYVQKSGQLVPTLLSVSLVRDDGGQPLYFISQIQDLTERKKMETRQSAEEDRYLRQRNALIDFTAGEIISGEDLTGTIQRLTETAAKTMDVARVSVWRYNPERTAIQCLDLYELAEDRHSSGVELDAALYPVYFQALAEKELIIAEDAYQDARTREFTDAYLRPLGITSMLDAPIHLDGVGEGVLCHEHIGSIRKWTTDEETFAVAVANLASLAMEGLERRRAEESSRVLITAVQQAKDSIMITDAEINLPGPRVTYVNAAFTAMTGYSDDEIIGKTPRILQGPKSDRKTIARLRQCLEKGELFTGEGINYRKDGTEYYQEWQIAPIREPGGKITHFVAIQRDVTERRRLADALESQKTDLRILFDYIPGLIWFKDTADRIIRINKRAADMAGLAIEEIEGRLSVDIYPEEPAEYYADDLEVIKSGVPKPGIGERLQNKDGKQLWVKTDKIPVLDRDGKVTGLVVIELDITERKQIEAQLVQSQKMETVGKLAGGIAHEFNSILTTIIGQSELLLRDLPVGTPLTKNANVISNAASRAAILTRQLLAYGRKQSLHPEILDLGKIVRSMEGVFHHILGREVGVSIVLTPNLQMVKVDAGQIEQVIMNMVMNAHEAMVNGGKLTLETANVIMDEEYVSRFPELEMKSGKYVALTITDTGQGMSDEVKARVFEPFFTTKNVGEGTGLGLSTCYGIIQQSGGHITIASKLGVGTTFRIYLPQVENVSKDSTRPNLPDLTSGKETILILQDDSALRDMMASMLRRSGYNVLAPVNGGDSLTNSQPGNSEHIDLVFADIVLPKVSNEEMVERVRAVYPGCRLLFALTNVGVTTNQNNQSSDVVFLRKPFKPSDLSRQIREILDHKNS